MNLSKSLMNGQKKLGVREDLGIPCSNQGGSE